MSANDVLALCAFALALLAFFVAEQPTGREYPLRSAILWMAGGAAIALGLASLFLLR